jgi:hypothetical protein
VIETFESYLLYSLDRDYDAEELEEDYRSVIFDDASKFDGMKIRRVRRHWCAMGGDDVDFYDPSHVNDEEEEEEEEEDSDDDKDEYEATEEEVKAFRANNTNSECILIDDEVLQSILNAPATPEEARKMPSAWLKDVGYVKVVDQQSGPGSGDNYPGWMRVALTSLWYVYGLDDLEAQYPFKDPKTGKRIVYTG